MTRPGYDFELLSRDGLSVVYRFHNRTGVEFRGTGNHEPVTDNVMMRWGNYLPDGTLNDKLVNQFDPLDAMRILQTIVEMLRHYGDNVHRPTTWMFSIKEAEQKRMALYEKLLFVQLESNGWRIRHTNRSLNETFYTIEQISGGKAPSLDA
jgi:hypothetical protein